LRLEKSGRITAFPLSSNVGISVIFTEGEGMVVKGAVSGETVIVPPLSAVPEESKNVSIRCSPGKCFPPEIDARGESP